MSETNIHSTAIVESGARIGEGVRIGPYCVIGPEVELGAGCELLSNVVVAKYIGGEMVKPAGGYCDQCRQDSKYEEAVMYDDDTEMAYCAKCAEDNGFTKPEGEEGTVAWLLLGGRPDSYGNALHTSPYAPRALWDGDFGDAEYEL